VKEYFRSMSFASDRSISDWRDVCLSAGTQAISVCGDLLAATTLALVLQQRGYGGLAVSGLLLAASVPPTVLAPLTGRLADRADSRLLLVCAGLGQAAVCVALAFATSPVAIIGLVAVLAAGLAVTRPVLSALLPAMVRRADLPKAGSLTQTAGMVGMLVAPALAGVLYGQVGARVPLLLDAASYLALIVAGLLLRTRRAPAVSTTGPQVTWRLRDDRALMVMIGALAAVVGAVGGVNVVEVFFIRETLHASATLFGLISAGWVAGMAIGAVAFGRMPRRRITMPVLLALMAGSCLAVLLAAAVPNAWVMLPLWVLGGVCNGGINVYVLVIVAERAPESAYGRAFAVMQSAIQGASMAGLLAAGPLVEVFAPRVLVAAAGAAGLLAAAACIPAMRSNRTPAVRPEPRSDPVGGGPGVPRVSVDE
jgi:MFS family permease